MATIENQTFTDENVAVDGNRYVTCTFTDCKLVFAGGELPVFDRCAFNGTSVQLEDRAFQTVKYLNGLYRGGLTQPVDTVVEAVREGNYPPGMRPDAPNPEQLGTNFRQLVAISLGVLGVSLALIAALIYGYIDYPINTVLNGEETRPLSAEFPLSEMPNLPNELAAAYDITAQQQRDQLSELTWVDRGGGIISIPIEDAMALVIDEGIPTWPATSAEEETGGDD